MEGHDAEAPDGRLVQIKATQGSKIGLRSKLQHLIVLFITSTGATEEIFNGPGTIAWDNAGNMQTNGQRPITTTKLLKLMGNVAKQFRLPKVKR
jgi:hypothetical protein